MIDKTLVALFNTVVMDTAAKWKFDNIADELTMFWLNYNI